MRRGTTPTLTFTMPFTADQVAVVYITFSQGPSVVLEKSEDVAVADKSLTVTLTQEDTLAFNPTGNPQVNIQVRIRLTDGSAAASQIINTTAGMILKNGVI